MATATAEAAPPSGKSLASRLNSCCHVNKDLLLLKVHFFLFFGSIAGVIPPLILYGQQLGLSMSMIGTLFGTLPFVQFAAKFAGGALADKFRIHKSVFVGCLIIMAASYFSMNFIRQHDDYGRLAVNHSSSASVVNSSNPTAEEDATFWSEIPVYIACPNTSLPLSNSTLIFCPRLEDETIPRSAFLAHILCEVDALRHLLHDSDPGIEAATTRGLLHRFGMVAAIGEHERYVSVDHESVNAFTQHASRLDASGNVRVCLAYRRSADLLTSLLNTSYEKMNPRCPSRLAGRNLARCVTVSCRLSAGDALLGWNGTDPLFASEMGAAARPAQSAPMFSLLWLWFGCILGWSSFGIVLSTSDAILLATLGDDRQMDFGYTRLFSSIGWGLMSPIASYLIDWASYGMAEKDFRPGYYVFIAMALANIAVAIPMKVSISEKPKNLVRDVIVLFRRPQVFLFATAVLVEGMMTGVMWTFTVVFANELNGTQLIIGLTYAVECFLSEIPFFLVSGWIVNRLGHTHSITLALAVSGVKSLLYSFCGDAWFLLPIGLIHGIMYGVFYATLATYANKIAPPGACATLQGIFQGLFEGIGVGIGSLMGGTAYDRFGGKLTFRIFGLGVIAFSVLYGATNFAFNKWIHLKCWAEDESNDVKGDLELKTEEHNS